MNATRRKRLLQPVWWRGEILGTVCVACETRPAVEAHHIIRLQVLRREANTRGFVFREVAFDRRNRIGLCTDCHTNHHSGARRLPVVLLERVACWVWDFAGELDLTWVLDRDYALERAA